MVNQRVLNALRKIASNGNTAGSTGPGYVTLGEIASRLTRGIGANAAPVPDKNATAAPSPLTRPAPPAAPGISEIRGSIKPNDTGFTAVGKPDMVQVPTYTRDYYRKNPRRLQQLDMQNMQVPREWAEEREKQIEKGWRPSMFGLTQR